MRYALAILIVVFATVNSLAIAQQGGQALQVDANFPGGNIIVERIDGDDVFLHQDLRDTEGYWFYWHFRVRGGAGRSLTFHFTQNERKSPIGVRGPAVSDDGGRTWRWLGVQAVRDVSFAYAVPQNADDVRFCFAFPYQTDDLELFFKRHYLTAHCRGEILCKSRKGRKVEVLFAGRLDGQATHRVALTCRHHSCEMMASYALEGILEEVLTGIDDGKWLRENVEFFIVPMVDKDGVEDGDQGKNRRPRDHNRDYAGASIYPEVAAIRERLPRWSEGKLRFAMDMHCPAVRGAEHESVYFVAGPNQQVWSEVSKFFRTLETVQRGPIVYRSKNNLLYGQGWNTSKNYTTGISFAHWAAELPGVRAATTIEVAYANAEGNAVTDESARALGHDLARALRVYLQTAVPKEP